MIEDNRQPEELPTCPCCGSDELSITPESERCSDCDYELINVEDY